MTYGLSPKLIPSIVAIAAGLLTAILVDQTAGLAILGTGVASLGVGYQLPAGEVISPPLAPPSDDRLSPDVVKRLDQEPIPGDVRAG